MKYLFEISKATSLTYEQVMAVFPENFLFETVDENSLLSVEEPSSANDQDVCWNALRECDRLAFLTGENLNPIFIRKVTDDGSAVVEHEITGNTTIVNPLALENVGQQQWDTTLAVQLRLWQLAAENLPIAAKVILLFQIIEISQPSFPKYTDSSKDPDPLTEAKFLRDLAGHGKQAVGNPSLELYCNHCRIPKEMHDPTNPDLLRLFDDRFAIVEGEARKVIADSITRKIA